MKRLPVDLGSTSTRTFVVYPALGVGLRLLAGRPLRKRYLPLLLWGYGQYRWSGRYRTVTGGGGPGMSVPPERLVTSGIYRYTRNPMYLGTTAFLLGMAIMLGSITALLPVPLFMLVIEYRFIRPEELFLETLFGEDYRAYRERVRRWL
jgi:hypothetical protein